MPKLRLFLSLNLDSNYSETLKQDQNALKRLIGTENIRWEDPDKFHLTLRFLGDMNEENVEPLVSTLERLKFDFEKIIFNTDKIDFFPNKRFPNVVFAGLKEKGNNTDTLVGFIDKIIFNFGVKPDKKFIPHITFGRFNRSKRTKIDKETDHKLSPLLIEFDSFCLMRSKLMQGGSVYELISEFKFNN